MAHVKIKPLVTILGVAYNLEDYIDKSIISALNQTYSHIQIIFVDDHSSDNTWEKLQQFKSQIELYRHKKRSYISAALNTGLEHARGDLIVRLDGDDCLYPLLVEKEVAYLGRHPKLGYVHCGYDVIDTRGMRIAKKKLMEYSPDNIYQVDMTAVGTMLKKECFDKVGRFDPEMHLQEMYEFYLRLSRHYRGGYLPQKLWAYTRRPGQATSLAQRMRFLKYTFLAIQKNYSPELEKITE